MVAQLTPVGPPNHQDSSRNHPAASAPQPGAPPDRGSGISCGRWHCEAGGAGCAVGVVRRRWTLDGRHREQHPHPISVDDEARQPPGRCRSHVPADRSSRSPPRPGLPQRPRPLALSATPVARRRVNRRSLRRPRTARSRRRAPPTVRAKSVAARRAQRGTRDPLAAAVMVRLLRRARGWHGSRRGGRRPSRSAR